MMGGLLVIGRLVMLAGFAMVLGCLLIVLRRMFVMLMNLVPCHFLLPDLKPNSPAW
jgi:hypothetical protein